MWGVCVHVCGMDICVYAFKINMFKKRTGQLYFPLKNLPLVVKLQKVLTCFGKSKFSFF